MTSRIFLCFWQLCVCLFYCTFSSLVCAFRIFVLILHDMYIVLVYTVCAYLLCTPCRIIADNFLSFVPSFYFLQHSCNSVRIFVSFASLVYGIATVSDGSVARRVQLAVVRACVFVCACVCGALVNIFAFSFCQCSHDVFFFFLYFFSFSSSYSCTGILIHATCLTVRDGTTTTTAITWAATGTGFRFGTMPVELIGATVRTWHNRYRWRGENAHLPRSPVFSFHLQKNERICLH